MNSSFPANHIHVNGEIRKNLVDIMSYVRFDASNKKKTTINLSDCHQF